MKKVERAAQLSGSADDQETAAMLEPRPGFSDDDVLILHTRVRRV